MNSKFQRLYPDAFRALSHLDPQSFPISDLKWLELFDLSEIQDLIVFGVGNGEVYHKLLPWLRENSTRSLVFVEEDLGALRGLIDGETGSLILEDKQVQLHFFDKNLIDRLIKLTYKRSALLISDPRAREDHYLRFRDQFLRERELMDWYAIEFMTFGVGAFYNFYHNLKYLPTSDEAQDLFGKAKGVPAIIVGAGPSLAKNGHLLKEVKDHGLLFAGGSGIPALQHFEMKPHFGAGVDPNILQYVRLVTCGPLDFPFIYTARTNTFALKQVVGPKLYLPGADAYIGMGWFHKRLNLTQERVETGTSVGTLLTELAVRMGCNPIILVGMDLAYTEDKIYADGIVSNDTISEFYTLEKDIHGNSIKTRLLWKSENLWYENYAKAHEETTFINATEGGMPIKGIENRTLDSVLKEYFRDKELPKDLYEFKKLGVTDFQIKEQLEILEVSLRNCLSILLDMFQFFNHIDIEHCSPEDILFPEPFKWFYELSKEPAYPAILMQFDTFYCSLISNSHLFYLIQRDGMTREHVNLIVHLHLKKINYLKEIIIAQLEMIKTSWTISNPV